MFCNTARASDGLGRTTSFLPIYLQEVASRTRRQRSNPGKQSRNGSGPPSLPSVAIQIDDCKIYSRVAQFGKSGSYTGDLADGVTFSV